LKADVLQELPAKIIQDYTCEMTQLQRTLYSYWEKIYNTTTKQKELTEDKKSIKKQSGTNKRKENNTLKMFDCMRKVCNYPGLVINEDFLRNPEYKNITKEDLESFNNACKLKAMNDLLISLGFEQGTITDIVNYPNKLLIFTQSKQMIDIIAKFINSNFPSIKITRLTSDMNTNDRFRTVNLFNSDTGINIMILTTSIGSLGLSLTAANIVIMYDHDWNPMKDLQAIDRTHRLGQKRTVEVFR
jgi:TATA-binding protein-associated factor